MGTRTLGNTAVPSPNSATWAFGGGQNVMDGGTNTMPEDGYVDTINVYFGATSGVVSTYHIIWNSALGVLASTGPNSYGALNWKSAGFAAGSFPFLASGTVFHLGVATNGSTQFKFRSSGSNVAKTGFSTPQSMASGTVTNQFISGFMGCYITYFPTANVTGIPSAPVPPGSSFQVTGRSFSAGVTGVSIGGVAAAGWSVVNDTTLNVTAPSQGAAGQVVVTTNAGTGTSAGSMIIGQVYWGDASGNGAVHTILSLKNGDTSGNGVVKNSIGIWVPVNPDGSGGVKRVW